MLLLLLLLFVFPVHRQLLCSLSSHQRLRAALRQAQIYELVLKIHHHIKQICGETQPDVDLCLNNG